MATEIIVNKKMSGKIRAVTFFTSGQRHETWLPVGRYFASGPNNVKLGGVDCRAVIMYRAEDQKNLGFRHTALGWAASIWYITEPNAATLGYKPEAKPASV